MKKTSKDFIEKALQSITEDRISLKNLYDKLDESMTNGMVDIVEASEIMTKISDSLSKQTFQLIEIAKISQKTEVVKSSDDEDDEVLTKKDQTSLYEQFENEEKIN